MRLEAITPERLGEALADRVHGLRPEGGGSWPRVLIDGAPAAGTGELADAVAQALRVRGRAALVVGAAGFLRAASLRFEHGRRDPDAYYERWLDTGALWREVLTPLDPGGSGRVLPDLWDAERDRATRSPAVPLPPGGVLLLHGTFLLGHWFPADLTVHLSLSPGALERRIPAGERWTLPAFARYEAEVAPREAADIVVRVDDPRRPAWTGTAARPE
ncbi:nucleoside/nucleotide kinase family protein [Streptomyces litchfieldiae]|uniref:Uridine kinase n=1 Tax=Streptomyces litchfieldiae TaxID=3075543 RepID=A0ABU2MSV6_9ACTN|nr:uridine kinase [Streptomyces sp. DSM 44938]MDT0344719.1 uridine kinase [Streptomyces sp. DSM 44938]